MRMEVCPSPDRHNASSTRSLVFMVDFSTLGLALARGVWYTTFNFLIMSPTAAFGTVQASENHDILEYS